METDKGRLFYATGIDNAQLRHDAAESRNILASIGQQAETESNRMDASFSKIAKAAGSIFALSQVKEFISHIITLRGEVESLEVSFNTLLGSEQKGAAMLSQIRQFAVQTPMMLNDLAKGAQTMLAFNIAEEKVMPMLKALGDVSMGDAQKFNSLTLAFSQMSATGKLMGQDLLQMINAGFNPLSVISEKTGKSIGELKEEMEKGKISAQMIEDAFISATSEGGKFYGMLEKQSHTVQGQLSNLQGAIEDMYNELGQKLQGTVSVATEAATYIVKNYEPLLTIIGSVIAVYGTYKAALMVNAAVEAIVAKNRAAGIASIEAEIAAVGTRTASQAIATDQTLREAVAKGTLTEAEALHLMSLKAEATARVEALQAAAVQAKAELATAAATEKAALSKFQAAEVEEAAAARRLALAKAQGEVFVIASAEAELNTAVNARNAASQEYQAAAAAKSAAAKAADTAATEANSAAVALNTINMQRGTMQAGVFRSAMNALDGAMEKVAATLRAHPYAAVAAAVVALGIAVYKLATYESEATKSTKAMHAAANAATAEFVAEEQKLAQLNETLKTTKKGSEEWLAAKNDLIRNFGKYHSGLEAEIERVGYLTTSYDELTKAIKKSIFARQLQNYEEKYQPDTASLFGEIMNTADDNPYVPNWEDSGSKFRTFSLTQKEKENLMKRMQDFVSGKDVTFTKKESQFLNWKGGLLEHNLYMNRLRKMRGEMTQYMSNIQAFAATAGFSADDLHEDQTDLTPTPTPTFTPTPTDTPTDKGNDDADRLAARAIEQKEALRQYGLEVAAQARQTQFDIRQAEIDAMQEGLERTLAQNQLNYDKLTEQNRERAETMFVNLRNAMQEQWEVENPNATETEKAQHKVNLATDITPETLNPSLLPEQFQAQGRQILSMMNSYNQLAQQAFTESNKEALRQALSDVLTYQQQREQVMTEYSKREEALYNHDKDGNRTGLREGVTQGNIDELNEQQTQALNAIDEQFAQREDSYQAWCEAIADLSLRQLNAVLQQAKDNLAELEKDPATDPQKLAVARAKVNKAQTAVNKAAAKNDVAPGKRTLKEWEDLYKVLQDVENEFESMGDTIGGTIGKIVSECGQFATSALTMINGIVQLTQMSATSIKGTAAAGATAISTMEKASIILTIISAALQIAMQIVNLFNNDDKKQKEIEKLQDRIDQLQWELDHAEIGRVTAAYGSAIDRVNKALQETRQQLAAGQQGWQRWLILMSRASKNQVLMEQTAEKLANAYANLAYTADKALGAKKYEDANDQLKNIAQQQILIQEQIDQEYSKKKTDHGQIQEWKNKIEELGQQALEIINDMVEDIIGDSAEGIAEELGDAFIEAFQSGEDAAEAWGDKVKEIVSDVLKRMLVSKFLEEPLGDIFDKYKSKWFPNGQFAGLDAVIASMNGFASDLNAVGKDFAEIWNNLPDSVKNMFEVTDEAEREASQKGIATADQDSIDELNGRMTAVQSHTFSISEYTKQLLTTAQALLRSLHHIEEETDGLHDRMERVENYTKSIHDSVDDIVTKGIKLK